MKLFIVLALFVASALAAPQSNSADANAVIEKLEADNIGTAEGYNYAYETSNGIRAYERGKLENVGTDDEGTEAEGQYSYQGLDGIIYSVTWTAGKNGFQAFGDHIPKA